MKQDIRSYLMERVDAESFITAVYLFGSHAQERAREDSDIDMAFLLDEKAYKSDPFETSSPAYIIAADLGMRLGKNTDVTILNSSSVEMTYEIITTGICLYERDRDRRFEYEAAARGMYFDFQPFIEQLRSDCVDRLGDACEGH